MTIRPDQWPLVKVIFNGAVALSGEARTAYLDEACSGDSAVRRHVDSLLASHDQAQSFLEHPAAAGLNMPSADDVAGRTVGSYRIESRLGSGGMGDVYTAHDARLDRPVALKLLSAVVARDPERLRRFRVEARAASSLNHPHIVVIHDFGELDGRPFIITELVEGQTLRHRLGAGPVPVRVALDIAVQIASALSAAHGRGIVHRDIKPENVMLRPDGYVKVLDFGLAKLTAHEPMEVTKAGTGTEAGIIMGTPQYMSPEQARGESVDFRSDQFSFGVVIYELITGRNPFARRSLVETAAAVIADELEPVDRLCPEVPPPLRWAIERCLAKNREERYGSTSDLHRDLATVHERLPDARTHAAALPGSNLPVPTTPLVGREADVAAAAGLLASPDIRWVTLTGPGGVGKTRLALQVAAELSRDFAGAVFFVPLAGITDSRLVPSAIAEALNVRATGGEPPLAALKRHLGAAAAPLLLVIDNFEHVTDAAPRVAELLECCPEMKVLVSSRSGMHVSAEHEYQVPALRLPDRQKTHGVEALAASPAVALFVERARAARADFALTDDNAKAIADICASLDGLPLAIELAAARVKVLPPQALLAHLEGKRLSLAGGARDVPARQQTLRNTIHWGYELLAPAEQRLFRRLAVFASGWTLEAAEAVCDGRQDLGLDVFEGISSLVDKSLVRMVDTAREARFTMLETIREYGLERLAEAGELSATRTAHAAYCLVLAEEGGSSGAAAQTKWLELCDEEHANLRAAIDFLIETRQAEWAMRLGAALLPFWQARAHLMEGKDRLTRALELGGAQVSAASARATFALGALVPSLGNPADAVTILAGALDAFRTLGDRRGIAVSLNAIGVCRHAAQDYGAVRAPFEEALGIWRELGDESAVARTLSNLAATALAQGDVARAGALYEQVRAACESVGDAAGAAWAMSFKAQVEEARGDRDAARVLYSDALARFRTLQDTWGTGDSLLALGHIACDSGATAESRQRFDEARRVFDAAGDIRGTLRVIEGFARLAAEEGNALRALTLAGAAAALRQKLSLPLAPTQREKLEPALEKVRQGSPASGVGTAWMEGWSMSAQDALQYAIDPAR